MTLPTPMAGCGATPCPKCGERSPCVDHCEVDIGVGFQTWNHEYWCPTHGGFAFVEPEGATDTWNPTFARGVIFRDEAEDPEMAKDLPKGGQRT